MLHIIDAHTYLSPRRGLIIERDAQGVYEVHLLLSWRGGKCRLFSYDYGQSTKLAVPERWMRFTWFPPARYKTLHHKGGHPLGGWEFAYGIQASPE